MAVADYLPAPLADALRELAASSFIDRLNLAGAWSAGLMAVSTVVVFLLLRGRRRRPRCCPVGSSPTRSLRSYRWNPLRTNRIPGEFRTGRTPRSHVGVARWLDRTAGPAVPVVRRQPRCRRGEPRRPSEPVRRRWGSDRTRPRGTRRAWRRNRPSASSSTDRRRRRTCGRPD